MTESRAWALVDHQFSHVFVQDADPQRSSSAWPICSRSSRALPKCSPATALAKYGLDHPRSGESWSFHEPNSWQAYYWWERRCARRKFARTVDIHRKPGYDPVELFFDRKTKGIPLDATLVQGSHGAPAATPAQRGVLLCVRRGRVRRRRRRRRHRTLRDHCAAADCGRS